MSRRKGIIKKSIEKLTAPWNRLILARSLLKDLQGRSPKNENGEIDNSNINPNSINATFIATLEHVYRQIRLLDTKPIQPKTKTFLQQLQELYKLSSTSPEQKAFLLLYWIFYKLVVAQYTEDAVIHYHNKKEDTLDIEKTQRKIQKAQIELHTLLQEYKRKGIPLHDVVIRGTRIISSVL